jgi:type II secretory pathway pseudopilin PulG
VSTVKGFSFVELLFVTALIATVTAIAIPQMLAGLDHWQTASAARYVSSRLHEARIAAAARTTNTAMRFVRAGASYEYAVFVDGNDNGIRARDIERGIDREIQPGQRLVDQFPGVDFGTLPGLPAVDPAAPPPGDDPIRLGASDMVAFTALGSSSPGSLYVRGRGQVQYVIRIFGETGKIRILKFHPLSREWKPL